MGEWHRKKEKAEERASGTCKHHISREEGGKAKGMRGKHGGASMRENETLKDLD